MGKLQTPPPRYRTSIHGIFQARVLEWGAIAFSHIYAQACLNNCDFPAPPTQAERKSLKLQILESHTFAGSVAHLATHLLYLHP